MEGRRGGIREDEKIEGRKRGWSMEKGEGLEEKEERKGEEREGWRGQ